MENGDIACRAQEVLWRKSENVNKDIVCSFKGYRSGYSSPQADRSGRINSTISCEHSWYMQFVVECTGEAMLVEKISGNVCILGVKSDMRGSK